VLLFWVAAFVVAWRIRTCRSHHDAPPPPPLPPPVVVAVDAAIDSPKPIDAAIDAAPPDAAELGIARLAVNSDPMGGLIVFDGQLVWTDSAGSIWAMPVTGGDGRELANQHDEDHAMYQGLVVHQGAVYAARTGDLARVDLPAGPVHAVGYNLGTEEPVMLASDNTAIYGAMFSAPSVWRFADGAHHPVLDLKQADIAIRNGTLYAMGYSTSTFMSVPTAGGKPRTIAHVPTPTAFAVDDVAGYAWCEHDHALRKIDLKTGKVTELWKTALVKPDVIVSDGDWIYAAASLKGTVTASGGYAEGDAVQLVRIAKDGSQLQVLVDGLKGLGPMTADADAVYATPLQSGVILRVDKARVQPLQIIKP
jgi:hypothetical protein